VRALHGSAEVQRRGWQSNAAPGH